MVESDRHMWCKWYAEATEHVLDPGLLIQTLVNIDLEIFGIDQDPINPQDREVETIEPVQTILYTD